MSSEQRSGSQRNGARFTGLVEELGARLAGLPEDRQLQLIEGGDQEYHPISRENPKTPNALKLNLLGDSRFQVNIGTRGMSIDRSKLDTPDQEKHCGPVAVTAEAAPLTCSGELNNLAGCCRKCGKYCSPVHIVRGSKNDAGELRCSACCEVCSAATPGGERR